MKVMFNIELKEGFRQTMETYEENEISIVVEAKNYATASRMVRALLKDAPNVATNYGGVCIED